MRLRHTAEQVLLQSSATGRERDAVRAGHEASHLKGEDFSTEARCDSLFFTYAHLPSSPGADRCVDWTLGVHNGRSAAPSVGDGQIWLQRQTLDVGCM